MSLETGQAAVFTWRHERWGFSLMGVVKRLVLENREVWSFGRRGAYQYLLLLRETLPVACGRPQLPFFLILRTLGSLKWPLSQLRSHISQHWQLVLANEL